MKDSFFMDIFLPSLGFITFVILVTFLMAGIFDFVRNSCETHNDSEKTLIISEDVLKRVTNIENMLGISQEVSE